MRFGACGVFRGAKKLLNNLIVNSWGGFAPTINYQVVAHIAQAVEHFLGKEEVIGSNPIVSTSIDAVELSRCDEAGPNNEERPDPYIRLVKMRDFNGLFVECINYLGIFERKSHGQREI